MLSRITSSIRASFLRSKGLRHASKSAVPIIDFAGMRGDLKDQKKVAEQVYSACKEIGFLVLVNHGMDQKLIQSAFQQSKQFFALPPAEKLKVKYTTAEANRGYLGVGAESLMYGLKDIKETYEIGYEHDPVYRNPWPSASVMPTFRSTMLEFFQAADKVHLQFLRSIALALDLSSPTHGYGNYFEPLCNGNHQNLRLLHYPACKRSDINDSTHRAGDHTDYGSITMVFQDEWGGLQVLQKNGEWAFGDVVPGGIVVNIADCLQRWSNNVLKSTRHRVLIDPRIKGDDIPARFSIAFFSNPNKETLVDALPGTFDEKNPKKFPPINAFEYLCGRLNDTIKM
eukprot:TRINITY_DN1473_c0_g2_i2.p1 TRINITY_DN1473_c0_g2~~TRINITY_DN1473_c0_g2_i2.p1  ORF type:complete len:341 (-),score=86.10 TRINITY_DN1473_c0_g2_i2:46-1068(-)